MSDQGSWDDLVSRVPIMRVVIPERERVAANGEVSAKGDAVKWHAIAIPHHVLRTITMATADPTGDHDQMVEADYP